MVGGGWWVNTHNLVKPTSTWLWLSWVLTIDILHNYMERVLSHFVLYQEKLLRVYLVHKLGAPTGY